MKRKNFSLIELLVVVAIIGILSSLLLPSLGTARDKAKAAVCLNNLKQLGFAFSMYAENNDFYVPSSSKGNGGRNTWDDYLSGYDGRDAVTNLNAAHYPKSVVGESYGAVYRCPTDTIPSTYGTSTNTTGRSYSITWMRVGDANKRFLGLAVDDWNTADAGITRNYSNLSKPAKTINLIEFHDTKNLLSSGWRDIRRVLDYSSKDQLGLTPHDGKANFLMADGHVEKFTMLQTLQKSDGTIATISDISDTIWDASK